MKHILVVDDDTNIREVTCFALEKAGYATSAAADGKEAINKFQLAGPDLIVLDIGMPELDGLEVCRTIRKTHETPILFLSARTDEIDRILGLEIGGDDYVTKPFSPRELAARVGAILKRVSPTQTVTTEMNAELNMGVVKLNTEHRSVKVGSDEVNLTTLEFNILRTLLSRPKMVFTRDQILSTSYGDNIHVSDRTIDSHIRNIRMKMLNAGCASAIDTVHGTGFRLGTCEMSQDDAV